MSGLPVDSLFRTPLSRRKFVHTALAGATVAASGVLVSTLAGCKAAGKIIGSSDNGTASVETVNEMASNNTRFADFRKYSYEGLPRVEAINLMPSLSNIVNLNQFTDRNYYYNVTELSADAIRKLEENAFVVSNAESWAEYFGVYESNRYNFAPSFITTDSALHTFHLMFDHVLSKLEEEHLYEMLGVFSTQMLETSVQQYLKLSGSLFENAAIRNITFFCVGKSILMGNIQIPEDAPPEVEQLVSQELENIKSLSIKVSDVMNYGEDIEPARQQRLDYSQFAPRSHFNKTPELQAYFKAQKWYGQATFRSAFDDELRSALLICNAISQGNNAELFYRLFEPINFFVGECDDITFYQYEQATLDVFGKGGLADIVTVANADLFVKAAAAIRKLAPPKINSLPIYNEEIQPNRDEAITGFRVLGERFTIDAAIFQKLIDRSVTDRMLPAFLDVPAAFGSDEAYAILKSEGVPGQYPLYDNRLAEAWSYFGEVSDDVWTSNLYWSWLYTLRPLIGNPSANELNGLPQFMCNRAWLRKQLDTFAGSWTELKHDTLLYSKQPLAERGGYGGEAPPAPDDRGYVEPNPHLFGRLASLVLMTIDGLSARDLLSDDSRTSLKTLQYLAESFTRMAEKELAGEMLSEEEYEIIRTYGGELEHIWETAKADELVNSKPDLYLLDHPCAIVSDVATDPNGVVLEEATGYAKEIYVIFPRNGELVLGRGAAYSHYEFTVPLDKRVTDETWHESLKNNEVPEFAEWKNDFIVDTEVEHTWARTRGSY